jgi:hypothetical protein
MIASKISQRSDWNRSHIINTELSERKRNDRAISGGLVRISEDSCGRERFKVRRPCGVSENGEALFGRHALLGRQIMTMNMSRSTVHRARLALQVKHLVHALKT